LELISVVLINHRPFSVGHVWHSGSDFNEPSQAGYCLFRGNLFASSYKDYSSGKKESQALFLPELKIFLIIFP